MRSIAPIHCLGRRVTYYDAWGVAIATPPVAVLIVCVSTAVSRMLGLLRAASKTQGGSLSAVMKKRVVFVLWLVHPGVSGALLQFFNCETIQGTTYLKRDHSLECYDKTWNGLFAVAVLA